MRLIDADKLENELVDSIYDNHAALHILWEQPTVCDIEQIRAEIDRQEKWLLQAGYTAYNVDIAFDSIKSVLAESEE